MKQLKASMPDWLAAQLEKASAESGRSLSAEICARIETSFAADEPTTNFLGGVARMPAEIELETGAAWHQHAGAHEAFVQAIISRLETLKPKGSIAFGDRPHATTSEDDPRKLGALIEFRLRRQPDFNTSGTRQLMEEEHQWSRADRMMGSPRALLDTPQQQPDQQRKKAKKL